MGLIVFIILIMMLYISLSVFIHFFKIWRKNAKKEKKI